MLAGRNWCSRQDALPKRCESVALNRTFASRIAIAPALATLSTSCLCWLDYASKRNGASSRCCPGTTFLQRKSAALLQGGREWSQSPVLPWAQRAYDARLSAGSTAVPRTAASHSHEIGAPTRSCTELASIPKKCIAQNALGAVKLVGARRLARPRLPDSESGGSAIPRQPRAGNWRP